MFYMAVPDGEVLGVGDGAGMLFRHGALPSPLLPTGS